MSSSVGDSICFKAKFLVFFHVVSCDILISKTAELHKQRTSGHLTSVFELASPCFAQGLDVLVRLIWRSRQRWLLGVRFIWRLRQPWLLGALRVRRCSWIGQRRFDRFVGVGGRAVEHDMAPGKQIEGERRRFVRCLVGRYNFQPLPSTLSVQSAPWDDGTMFKIARF